MRQPERSPALSKTLAKVGQILAILEIGRPMTAETNQQIAPIYRDLQHITHKMSAKTEERST
jgi:hypothetical protein